MTPAVLPGGRVPSLSIFSSTDGSVRIAGTAVIGVTPRTWRGMTRSEVGSPGSFLGWLLASPTYLGSDMQHFSRQKVEHRRKTRTSGNKLGGHGFHILSDFAGGSYACRSLPLDSRCL